MARTTNNYILPDEIKQLWINILREPDKIKDIIKK
jgi:hypothetical protein